MSSKAKYHCEVPDCGAMFEYPIQLTSHKKRHITQEQKEAAKKEPVKLELLVIPAGKSVSINGVIYKGRVKVDPGLANSIRSILQTEKQSLARVGQYIDHGIRNLGTIR